jgi:N-acetylmuramoyl-L-alanine amidase
MYQNAYLDKSLDFAGMIQEQYKSNIKTINRGVKQAEIFVLYKTAMPAVLTEVGFISNPEEEQYMMSDEGQATIVVSIFKAFLNYKSTVEGTKVPTDLKIDLKGYKAKGTKNSTPTKETPKKTIESPTTEQANSTVEGPTEKKTEIPVASIPSTMLPSTAQTDVEPPLAIPEPEIKEPVKAVVTTTEDTPDDRVPAADASGVEYRVQFLSSNKELKEGARELKGVKDYSYYMQNGVYRYTTGNFKDVKAAVKRQKEIRELGFKDAFIVAFNNGNRISLQMAKELLGQ